MDGGQGWVTRQQVAIDTAVILAGLARLTPDIPVVAEEAVAAGRIPRVGERFWLVDLGPGRAPGGGDLRHRGLGNRGRGGGHGGGW